MGTFTKEKLDKILESHQHWILKDCVGWETMMANLSYADLSGADLSMANLSDANLYGANLHCVDLRDADLRDADLSGANLYHANLYGANMSGAYLCGANLYGANLHCVDLRDADLRDADLSDANLHHADLRGAKNIPFIPMACPDVGSFTGWKKCMVLCGENLDATALVIVELEIPAYAKRSSATGRKCRCNKAIVKAITSIYGSESFGSAFSKHDPNFIYKVGGLVSVDNFDADRFNECAPGIHFFINRQEAVDYDL